MKDRAFKVDAKYTKLKGYNRISVTPKLILCGKWLEDVGIFSGDRVKVEVLENQIIIKAV
jgi:hypothetical protein